MKEETNLPDGINKIDQPSDLLLELVESNLLLRKEQEWLKFEEKQFRINKLLQVYTYSLN